AVVGKLSGGIAHEIRNPLSAISASAYYLKEKLQDADEKTKSHIKRISNQVNISNDIIQNMQNLTQMRELDKTQIDIAVAIESGISISKMPQTVKVISKVPEGEFIVTVDVKQISIVFKNILINAIEAMDNGGTIWITAHKSGDKWVEISFKNSGHGITQENLKKIFQPFFGTKKSGFGFGLALCKTIMEKHGGDITAQSEEGKDTTFVVRLPAPCRTDRRG
ncbi:MAG: sensor histidine kinase, partial [Candidatus Scalindua sp.]